MKQTAPFVITISRQLGSGGSYTGQRLAKEMGVSYADREIISEAAKQLSVLESDLESRDERILSFWQSFIQFSAFAPDVYSPPKPLLPTNRKLFETEEGIIRRIANEHSAIIIGRCGFHVLREHPNCINIFLHGDLAFRSDRIQQLYTISAEEAKIMITECDKERSVYNKTFTGKEWTDARQYDLSVDTSKIGLDKSVELILDYFKLI
jgi:CMP/dCMP kinase